MVLMSKRRIAESQRGVLFNVKWHSATSRDTYLAGLVGSCAMAQVRFSTFFKHEAVSDMFMLA